MRNFNPLVNTKGIFLKLDQFSRKYPPPPTATCVPGSERLDSNVSLSKTWKTAKDQKKSFARALRMAVPKKNENVQEKLRNPASLTLTLDFIATELHHGH